MRGRPATTFREIRALEAEDGIIFDPASVEAQEIRKEANYAGIRITLMGSLFAEGPPEIVKGLEEISGGCETAIVTGTLV